MVLDGKSSQEYPVNTGFPQGSILDSKHFLLYMSNLPGDTICNIGIPLQYAEDTTLLCVIRNLICSNKRLTSMLEKLYLLQLTGRITVVLLI